MKGRIAPLILHFDRKELDGPREVNIDVSQDFDRAVFDRSRPAYVKGVAFTLIIPFEGEEQLFQCRPSIMSWNPPRGSVVGNELRISFRQASHDAKALKREIEEVLKGLQEFVPRLARDVEGFNASLPDHVRKAVRDRRERLSADKKLGESLGIPLRRRPQESYQVVMPPTRRKADVRTTVPADAVIREAFMADADYKYILKVIRDVVAVMERSPKTFAQMGEVELRDILLVVLNAHYEGRATGETFNFHGKTDILIREAGKNVFIGECKLWGGPKEFSDAINQVLGYASWRDTKIALLIFNKKKDTSVAIKGIAEAAPKHTCFKRDLGKTDESSFQFVFHQPGDKGREVTLSVLVFDVPSI